MAAGRSYSSQSARSVKPSMGQSASFAPHLQQPSVRSVLPKSSMTGTETSSHAMTRPDASMLGRRSCSQMHSNEPFVLEHAENSGQIGAVSPQCAGPAHSLQSLTMTSRSSSTCSGSVIRWYWTTKRPGVVTRRLRSPAG
eukprot:Amastigsp_a843768_19.p5 type:complete len:140 gc:universal Amastigsp_a843768_19:1085-666(-)